jgi:phosphatidylserine/phosphatidylglycerophosphate/cardiolipin synthase-like enzyme
MHAKFVLSDNRRGLLGSANLTSLGLRHHVEVGVPLTAAQCRDLERLLDGLIALGLLSESDPCGH